MHQQLADRLLTGGCRSVSVASRYSHHRWQGHRSSSRGSQWLRGRRVAHWLPSGLPLHLGRIRVIPGTHTTDRAVCCLVLCAVMDWRSLRAEHPGLDLPKLPAHGQPFPGFCESGYQAIHWLGSVQRLDDTHPLRSPRRHEAHSALDECDLGGHACMHDDLVSKRRKCLYQSRSTDTNDLASGVFQLRMDPVRWSRSRRLYQAANLGGESCPALRQ